MHEDNRSLRWKGTKKIIINHKGVRMVKDGKDWHGLLTSSLKKLGWTFQDVKLWCSSCNSWMPLKLSLHTLRTKAVFFLFGSVPYYTSADITPHQKTGVKRQNTFMRTNLVNFLLVVWVSQHWSILIGKLECFDNTVISSHWIFIKVVLP